MAIPILKSSDLERSLRFYTGTLGAELLFRAQDQLGGPGYAGVKWREHELHVSSHAGDGAFGSAVYLSVNDVDAVFAELVARGYVPPSDRGPVFAGPTDQTWGMRELCVQDPDGNRLCFGQPRRP